MMKQSKEDLVVEIGLPKKFITRDRPEGRLKLNFEMICRSWK